MATLDIRRRLSGAWNGLLAPAPDESVEAAADELVPMEFVQGVEGEKGVTGLRAPGGRIRREYNEDLRTLPLRMTVFEEMRRSDTACAAIEMLLSLPIRAAEWYIEPGEDAAAAKEIEDNLGIGTGTGTMTMSWDEVLRQALLAPLYGFHIHEKVFEVQESGWLGWRKFAERDRTTVDQWFFDETGGMAGLKQVGYAPGSDEYRTTEFKGMDKLLVWIWRKEAGDPEGLGMFRQAYKAYVYLSAFEEFAAIRIERQACGIPTATGPEVGYTDKEAADVLAILKRLRTGEETGLVAPDGWTFGMLDIGRADVPFEAHLERERQYILQTGGVGFVGLGQGGDTGAWALSRDLSSTFMLMLGAIGDWVEEYFNRYAIPQIVRLNKSGVKRLPQLRHGSIAVRDPRVISETLKVLFDRDLEIPDDVEASLREMMGLRKMEDGAPKEKPAETPELTPVED